MLTIRTFVTSKKGEDLDDCQDSIHPRQAAPEDSTNTTLAVSDGTTTSFFSRVWSHILTRNFAAQTERAFSDWEGWLREAQIEWKTEIEKIVEGGKASFIVVNGFRSRKPAAATFVGLAIKAGEDFAHWRALVLGDSCLFILSKSGQPTVRNLQKSEEFSSVVQTVESWPKDGTSYLPIKYESTTDGEHPPLLKHDAIILASDALSKWMLSRNERGSPVWASILAVNNEQQFLDLVAKAREEEEDALENDDVALAFLKFGEPHPIYSEAVFVSKPTPRQPNGEQTQQTGGSANKDASFALLPESPAVMKVESPLYPNFSKAPLTPQKRLNRFKRFVLLFALSACSIYGIYLLIVSLNRARDQVRGLTSAMEHFSAEYKALGAQYNTIVKTTKVQIQDLSTEKQALLDAKRRLVAQKEDLEQTLRDRNTAFEILNNQKTLDTKKLQDDYEQKFKVAEERAQFQSEELAKLKQQNAALKKPLPLSAPILAQPEPPAPHSK